MFPIKILKLFEAHNESAANYAKRPTIINPAPPPALSWPDVERRSGLDRRHQERRALQQAIMLDTRKVQGRRRCAGRRQTDLPAMRYSLTVKG